MENTYTVKCAAQDLTVTPAKLIILHKISGKQVQIQLNKISAIIVNKAGILPGNIQFVCDGTKETVTFSQYEQSQIHSAKNLIELYQTGEYDETDVKTIISQQQQHIEKSKDKLKKDWKISSVVGAIILIYLGYVYFTYEPTPSSNYQRGYTDSYDYNFDGKVDGADVEEFVRWKEQNRKE